jgi:hypothetical protein
VDKQRIIQCRAYAMEHLWPGERLDAIAAAPNVIGFERFRDRAGQVRFDRTTRMPAKP